MTQLIWAPSGFENDLAKELSSKHITYQKLAPQIYLAQSEAPLSLCWAEAIGYQASKIEFTSISQAQTQLKKLGKLWCHWPLASVRRGELVLSKLSHPKPKKWQAFEKIPSGKIGCYFLTHDQQLWATPHLHPPVHPLWGFEFEQSQKPPSRAYLKLWEIFFRIQHWPTKNSRVLELGSAPGGWTWVIADQLGAQVTCLDRGDMSPDVANLPQVQWLQKDAFQFCEQNKESYDWLLSDMACEPQKLLELVTAWSKQFPQCQMICTIKFTEQTPDSITDDFLKIEGSQIIHLKHNKHELTWMRVGSPQST